jgi:glycosyltransferase involved in cell wall biosynthesis
MNILQVVPYFYPAHAFGGPVKVAYSISRELVKQGHHVTVYTTDAKNPHERLNLPNVADVDGIKVHYMRNISLIPIQMSNLFISPKLAFVSKSDLSKFDIIHLHEFTTLQNVAMAYHAGRLHLPYVLQAHGSVHFTGRRGRKLVFNAIFGKYILRKASRVVALSQVEELQYRKMGLDDGKIAVIPNGIDLTDYSDLPRVGLFKKKIGLNDSERIILFLGRLHRIKGVDLLVRAFASVAHKRDNVTLVIVGPDEGCLDELNALVNALQIGTSVKIVGPLYGSNKLEAYVDAEVVVLPSRYEAFPMGILEAYACGKPVVASNVGSISDLVIDGVTGFLVKPESVSQLASSLLQIMDSHENAAMMGAKGKKVVEEKFQLSAVVKKLLALYQDVVNESRNQT